LTTAADGKNYNTKFYNLDAIISKGIRSCLSIQKGYCYDRKIELLADGINEPGLLALAKALSF